MTAKRSIFVFVALAATITGCLRARTVEPERFVGGVQVNEPDHLVWSTRLSSLGFNTVAVTVYAKQGDWDSANLWYEEQEPAVLSEIRIAKTLGLKVVLILRVALDHAFERNRFLWHGMIFPKDDKALTEWFERYGAFTAKWAKIAEREGVDVLGVASEMSALTNTKPVAELPNLEAYYLDAQKQAAYRRIIREANLTPRQLAAAGAGDFVDPVAFVRQRAERWAAWAQVSAFQASADPVGSINTRRARLDREWRALIARVRQDYHGPLTYAANFDQYETVGFWDALDLVGVNAYFVLRDQLEHVGGVSVRAELTAGWTGVLEQMQRFLEGEGLADRRVLFTELGYTRRSGATAAPWAMGGFEVHRFRGEDRVVVWTDQPLVDGERAAAMHALADVTSRAPFDRWFAGVLYWKLSTIRGHAALEPFVLIADEAYGDPMLPALRRIAQ